MYCRNCGTPNVEKAVNCASCGAVLEPAVGTKIDNYLVLAIVVTVLCCLPLGIVGIVYAAQVNPKVQAGDLAGAQEASRKARLWTLWGLGLGLTLYLLYGLVFTIAMISEAGRM
jgi:interferon-induced transmembrane protein